VAALSPGKQAACPWLPTRVPCLLPTLQGAPCVVHLAATGDHGYTRRTHLGLPLVQQVKGLLAVLQ